MPGWTNLFEDWKGFFVRLCENGNTEHLRFYEARPALASISFIFTNQTMTCNHLDTNVTIFLMILGRIFLVTMLLISFSNIKLQQTSRNTRLPLPLRCSVPQISPNLHQSCLFLTRVSEANCSILYCGLTNVRTSKASPLKMREAIYTKAKNAKKKSKKGLTKTKECHVEKAVHITVVDFSFCNYYLF